MQLDLGLTTGTGPALVGGRDARLAQLAPFLLGTLRPALARDSQVEREQRDRRRLAQREDIAAQIAAQPTPADRLQQAEREQAPGSRAAERHEYRAYLREQARARQGAFRHALAGAARRPDAPQDLGVPPRGTADAPPPARPSGPAPATAAPVTAAPVASTASGAGISGVRTDGGLVAVAGGPPRTLPGGWTGPTARPPIDALRAGAGAATPAAVRGVGTVGAASAARPGPVERGPTAGGVFEATPNGRAAGRPRTVATAPPQPDEDGNSDPNMARIVRFIQAQLARERAVTTLRLDPPELGSLRLRLELQRDRLSVEMAAESRAARQLLEQHLDALRRSLEAVGLQLERVVVRTLDGPDGLGPGGLPPEPDAQTASQGQAHTAWQEAAPRGDADSGRGAPTETALTETAATEAAATQAVAEPGGPVGEEPATESRVNVWA